MSTSMENQGKPITTHDMVVVHRMFRREFREAAARVRGVRHGSRAQVRLVADRVALLLDTLHHHHEVEARLLWPKLAERAPGQSELWKRMQVQHADLAARLERAGALLGPWTAGGASARGEELAAVLEQVSQAVGEHFDQEEREALPLVPAVVSQAEWDEIGDAASAALPKSRLLTVLGMILKDADPGEQILIMAHLPLAPRVIWRAVGERNFRRLEERLAAAVGHG
ncbi:hemerythrin domain-containing protein [Streptomyces sp. A1547]|uniref:hemerythrin domain-containing protein n=1 Tax=Streptomyces sp. A1547 TaxID=2563105 RepID=UPI00109E3E1C|nr:hemerythrin domain-containing protein [Streptomyces sp. A1547]THA40280.1 hemerythrin domain-containing protein [Streptomyces sp. A1547]